VTNEVIDENVHMKSALHNSPDGDNNVIVKVEVPISTKRKKLNFDDFGENNLGINNQEH
jgi:hypothetical protein